MNKRKQFFMEEVNLESCFFLSYLLYQVLDAILFTYTARKMKFYIKDFFSKCYEIRSFLRIWSHLLKKSLMENFIFCAMLHNKYINRKKRNPLKEKNKVLLLEINMLHLHFHSHLVFILKVIKSI